MEAFAGRGGTYPVTIDDDGDRRLRACLGRLASHVDAGAIALAGSAAVEVHFEARGLPRLRPVLNDVDFVAATVEAVSPSVTTAFLVSHFHRPQPGYPKFMVQLVDPESRLRVDFFPAHAGTVEHARERIVGGAAFRVLELHAVLDHKLTVLGGASELRPVDRKHLDDARRLGHLLGREVEELPASVLCKDVYSTDTSAVCSRCERSLDEAFRLAPKQRIFDVLGYV